jgi:hypothetical protein
MVRNRASAEEDYARSLQRVAGQAEVIASVGDEEVKSTFKDSLEALRADMLNKAVQHTNLGENLRTEVCEPIQQVKDQLVTQVGGAHFTWKPTRRRPRTRCLTRWSSWQSRDLNERSAALSKNLRGLEKTYRASHAKFEKAYQAAAAACSQVR